MLLVDTGPLVAAADTDDTDHRGCRELLETLGPSDWERIGELVAAYADLRLGGTDASLITIAERLGATTIATLNHRDFTVVRPRHTDTFELIP